MLFAVAGCSRSPFAIRQAKERRHFHYVLSESSFVCSCMFFDLAAYAIVSQELPQELLQELSQELPQELLEPVPKSFPGAA